LTHLFTTRFGGVSTGACESLNLGINRGDKPENVRENYRRLAKIIGCDRFVFANQRHTANILHVTSRNVRNDVFDPADYVADGLVTNEKNIALVVFTADCVPVLLEGENVIAAVHAGWRGTSLGIAAKAVREMGCRPDGIKAYIGPSIGSCCYETDKDVPEAMTALMGGEALPFIKPSVDRPEKFYVDLKNLNRRQLELAGVKSENIEVSKECTHCLHEKYWSHRYTKGVRGSMCGVIVM
jgi:YfiH family protein